MRLLRLRFCLVLQAMIALAQQPVDGPLKLVATVRLPQVNGRIDHLAVDVANQRLFIAALGNNTVEVVDLKQNRLVHTITGMAEPQGIAYVRDSNQAYVANGADGTVRVLDAKTWTAIRTVSFGDDADNLRIDSKSGHLWVGFGAGALGEFDLSGNKLGEIKLGSHPESFRLESSSSRIYVNLPKSREIAVCDRATLQVLQRWSTGGPQSNYAMILNEMHHRLFVVARSPASLIVVDTASGKVITTLRTIGDADDIFFDEKRKRLYIIGGEGGIAVIDQKDPDHYEERTRVPTVAGARTGLYSPELDRLYVAVRRHGNDPAEIRIYAPN